MNSNFESLMATNYQIVMLFHLHMVDSFNEDSSDQNASNEFLDRVPFYFGIIITVSALIAVSSVNTGFVNAIPSILKGTVWFTFGLFLIYYDLKTRNNSQK